MREIHLIFNFIFYFRILFYDFCPLLVCFCNPTQNNITKIIILKQGFKYKTIK
jgi:hypothetical protein